MGMFDYIRKKLYCPYCGNLFKDEFQTKSFERFLWRLKLSTPKHCRGIDEEARIYSGCKKCGAWVELIIPKSAVQLPTQADRERVARTMDKNMKEMEKTIKKANSNKI